MYMMGQVADAARPGHVRSAALHDDVAVTSSERLGHLPDPALGRRPIPSERPSTSRSSACPAASRRRPISRPTGTTSCASLTPSPRSRRHAGTGANYFDPDPTARDKVYSRWGGFLDDVPFDPVRYGIPPSSLPSIEPLQLLTLEVVRAALDDAGYARPAVRPGAHVGDPRRGRRRRRPGTAVCASALGCRCSSATSGPEVLSGAAGVDRGLVRRDPAQRRGRAGHQPVRSRRGELHGRCRLRLLARRGVSRVPRARGRGRGHGHRRRSGHGAEPVRLSLLQQDAGPLADRAMPPVRRAGRWHRDQRGRRRARAEAPGGRRARRRSDLRRDQGRRPDRATAAPRD